jgi:hypothetical protein
MELKPLKEKIGRGTVCSYQDIFVINMHCIIHLRLIPQVGWVKQHRFVFFQFWRLKVQNKCATSICFCWGLSTWLVDGILLCCHMAFPLSSECVYVWGERQRERERERAGVSGFFVVFSIGHWFFQIWVLGLQLYLTLITFSMVLSPNTVKFVVRVWTFECGSGGHKS